MCHGTCTQAAVCLSVGSSQPASQPVSHDPPQPPLPYRLFRSKSQSLAAQPAVVNDEQATTSAPAQMLRPMFFASSLCSSSDQWRCGNRRALGESRVSENSTFFWCVSVSKKPTFFTHYATLRLRAHLHKKPPSRILPAGVESLRLPALPLAAQKCDFTP